MRHESANEIGLLGANGGSVSTVGYLLMRASLMWMALSREVMSSIGETSKMALIF